MTEYTERNERERRAAHERLSTGALARWTRACATHPWRVVGGWVGIVVVLFGLMFTVGGSLRDEFEIPGSDTQRATDLIEAEFASEQGGVLNVVFAAPEGAAQGSLNSALFLVKETIQRVRTITSELRPTTMDYSGLYAALREYGEEFRSRTGVAVKVRVPRREIRLPGNVEATLFRIVQEALHNCAKHAQAKAVAIELKEVGGRARISIADDGAGFDTDAIPSGPLGLGIMRERAQAIGIWAGVLPGVGATAGTWLAYGQAVATAKDKRRQDRAARRVEKTMGQIQRAMKAGKCRRFAYPAALLGLVDGLGRALRPEEGFFPESAFVADAYTGLIDFSTNPLADGAAALTGLLPAGIGASWWFPVLLAAVLVVLGRTAAKSAVKARRRLGAFRLAVAGSLLMLVVLFSTGLLALGSGVLIPLDGLLG